MSTRKDIEFLSPALKHAIYRFSRVVLGFLVISLGITLFLMIISYNVSDPSFNTITNKPVQNWLGLLGSYTSDILLTTLGFTSFIITLIPFFWGMRIMQGKSLSKWYWRCLAACPIILLSSGGVASFSLEANWASYYGAGGFIGYEIFNSIRLLQLQTLSFVPTTQYINTIDTASFLAVMTIFYTVNFFAINWLCFIEKKHYLHIAVHTQTLGYFLLKKIFRQKGTTSSKNNHEDDESKDLLEKTKNSFGYEKLVNLLHSFSTLNNIIQEKILSSSNSHTHDLSAYNPLLKYSNADHLRTASLPFHKEPSQETLFDEESTNEENTNEESANTAPLNLHNTQSAQQKTSIAFEQRKDIQSEQQSVQNDGSYIFPSTTMLKLPPKLTSHDMNNESLEENALLLEEILKDFGVKGKINHIRPGPVVTLYELEPAPGTKTSRVIGLSEDIARSMSAISVRIATIPGRSVIGIEMPNAKREICFFT